MIALYVFLVSLVSIVLILFLLYLLVLVRPRGNKPDQEKLLCDYAHRGLHDGNTGPYPENSLAAFELACREDYGIELDVQLSHDGVVMVFHDYTLVRMTGVDKKLCELDSEDLCSLKLKGTEERIPTFEQVLSLVDGRVPLLVELKGESFDTSLCEKVAEHLKAYKGEYCVESFNPLLIKDIKKYLPDVFCGQLYTNVCRDKKKKSLQNIALTLMALNFLAKPDFIAYNKCDRESLPVKITTRLYKAPRFVWTVKNEEEKSLAHSLGEYPIFER